MRRLYKVIDHHHHDCNKAIKFSTKPQPHRKKPSYKRSAKKNKWKYFQWMSKANGMRIKKSRNRIFSIVFVFVLCVAATEWMTGAFNFCWIIMFSTVFVLCRIYSRWKSWKNKPILDGLWFMLWTNK